MDSIIRTATRAQHPATRRVGRLARRAAAFGSTTGAERFARGVLARHAAGAASLAPVEAVLRARPDAGTVNLFQMIASLSIRQDLIARIVSSDRNARPQLPASARRMDSRDAATARAVAARTRSSAAVSSPSRIVLERLFARAHRLERPVTAEPPHAVGGSGRHAAAGASSGVVAGSSGEPPGIDALLRKSPARQPADAVERSAVARLGARVAVDRTGPTRAIHTSAAARPSPATSLVGAFSAADLGRLTDQVVRAIDQRIVAQRERKGVI